MLGESTFCARLEANAKVLFILSIKGEIIFIEVQKRVVALSRTSSISYETDNGEFRFYEH